MANSCGFTTIRLLFKSLEFEGFKVVKIDHFKISYDWFRFKFFHKTELAGVARFEVPADKEVLDHNLPEPLFMLASTF